MAFTAFLDTCTLFGGYLCDTFLRLAEAETYRPLWSADVLDELHRNLLRRGLAEPAVNHRINSMRRAFPDADVTGYQSLMPGLTCDEKDRHVLAAAIRGSADVLVTFNISDFPARSTEQFDLDVITPDDFLLDQLDLHPSTVIEALDGQADAYRRPPVSTDELLHRLTAAGVPRFSQDAQLQINRPPP